MNVLDLFSGIGGFSLGLERAGMRTIAFCEIDPYCQAVLRRHWPDVPIFGDVRTLTLDTLADAEGERCGGGEDIEREGSTGQQERVGSQSCGQSIDVICGGFPCQDISVAGKGAGIEGARSGLWSEFARIIGEVRPRYVIVENVAALLGRGIERVLGDLAAIGYDAEWHCIPACAIGAPHRRDRVWIVAYAMRERRQQIARSPHGDEKTNEGRSAQYNHQPASDGQSDGAATQHFLRWQSEPDVGRVAHGVPFRVDRLRSLGNAIVPQIAEIIGKAIMNV